MKELGIVAIERDYSYLPPDIELSEDFRRLSSASTKDDGKPTMLRKRTIVFII